MGKTDVGPTAVADCGPMKMQMEARHRADEFCQLGCNYERFGWSRLLAGDWAGATLRPWQTLRDIPARWSSTRRN